ncbi:MAG: YicC/YloC family endoribonuclease [Alphaproteobacteria bacterium]
MSLSSMTGFARTEGANDGYGWGWELRSVNARNLDSRLRLPPGSDRLEAEARKRMGKQFKRGNISANLTLTRVNRTGGLAINRDVLGQVLALVAELRAEATGAAGADVAPPRIDGLLNVRGVLEQVEEEESEEARDELYNALIASFSEALDALARGRDEEGARLAVVVEGQIDEIAGLVGAAEKVAEAQPEALDRRLRDRMAELLENDSGLSEERLHQEVALLVAKADVREELDRLIAHIEAARELIAADDAVGRRLDFLCQEFNREANTLCSKAADIELTRIGLDLKAVIEQLREQIQNIE